MAILLLLLIPALVSIHNKYCVLTNEDEDDDDSDDEDSQQSDSVGCRTRTKTNNPTKRQRRRFKFITTTPHNDDTTQSCGVHFDDIVIEDGGIMKPPWRRVRKLQCAHQTSRSDETIRDAAAADGCDEDEWQAISASTCKGCSRDTICTHIDNEQQSSQIGHDTNSRHDNNWFKYNHSTTIIAHTTTQYKCSDGSSDSNLVHCSALRYAPSGSFWLWGWHLPMRILCLASTRLLVCWCNLCVENIQPTFFLHPHLFSR